MSEARPDARLVAAMNALAVTGPTTYAWLGEAFDLPEPVRRLAPPEGLRAALLQAIRWRLYADFFTAGRSVPPPGHRAWGTDRAFVRALSAANAGTRALEPGWTYVRHDGDRLVVERLGLHVWAAADEVAGGRSRRLAPGEEVEVWMPKEVPNLSPGFYMALSNRGLDPDRPRLLDRFYLNIGPADAPALMALVTRRLNAADVPFRLKVVDDPTAFERCDSAVLTLQRKDRAVGLAHVSEIHAEVEPQLRPLVPGLCFALAPGLGFSEDPGGRESFGAHRCGLIAEALVEAHERGLDEPEDRMALLRDHMTPAGTTPETPYLGPDSGGEPVLPSTLLRTEEPVPCP